MDIDSDGEDNSPKKDDFPGYVPAPTEVTSFAGLKLLQERAKATAGLYLFDIIIEIGAIVHLE
jgi:hypothetical protein